jgi:uncharacterized protein involved in exopolysaccharide biosynthesis
MPPAPDKGFDPEAEQEVDFARYGRMLARRWWLVAIGVVAGAVIGFLVSLGGSKLFSATATIYLGQPYNGATPIVTLQTNPTAVGQIASSQAVDAKVATQCSKPNAKVTVEKFRKGISVQKVASASTSSSKSAAVQVNPLVTLTVQTAKGKVATCVANALAREAVAGIATYPQAQIAYLEKHVASDTEAINSINAAIAGSSVSGSDKLALVQALRGDQADLYTTSQALLVAKDVEMPKVTIRASAHQISAQSPRNTVVIAALIGLILGVLAALLWDRVLPRLAARNGS